MKTARLVLRLGASQARKRLKGHGYGVRKIETAGNRRCVVVHTATGQHLEELRALLSDVLEPDPPDAAPVSPEDEDWDE